MSYSIALEDLLKALLRAMKAHERADEDHSQRSRMIATAIGEKIGLNQEELLFLGFGADIHDVGKIGVDQLILRQPSRLTEGQVVHMRAHVEIGYKIIEPLHMPQIIKDVVLYHHERFDGTGYPTGKQGNAIPFAARVVCLADFWDAITSDRPYRPAMPFEKALFTVTENAQWFDPVVLAAWLDILRVRRNEFRQNTT